MLSFKLTMVSILTLIASRRGGWSLPGGFYCEGEVYDSELETIWRRQWLIVAHTCRLPEQVTSSGCPSLPMPCS